MSQAADRYAKALFELAGEQNILETVQTTLGDIKNLLGQSKDFRQFVNNPLLSYTERCNVFKAIFEGRVPALFYQFLLFLTHKKRLNLLGEIISSFDEMYLKQTGQMRACVKTALELGDAEKNAITSRLQDKFNRKMLIRWMTDPSLIGGFRIFAEGKIYDYSFKSQLNQFFQQSTQLV